MNHEVRLVFGDLNFRINASYTDGILKSEDFEHEDQLFLKERDQLLPILKEGKEFPGLIEGFIDFWPTYKYDPGTDNYDTSKKQRVPAWCDWVLWWENEQHINLISYERRESMFSDHKPVIAYFTLHTFETDHEMKETLKQKLMMDFNLNQYF